MFLGSRSSIVQHFFVGAQFGSWWRFALEDLILCFGVYGGRQHLARPAGAGEVSRAWRSGEKASWEQEGGGKEAAAHGSAPGRDITPVWLDAALPRFLE